jgi:hypothetical protein
MKIQQENYSIPGKQEAAQAQPPVKFIYAILTGAYASELNTRRAGVTARLKAFPGMGRSAIE